MPQKTLKFNHPDTTISRGTNAINLIASHQGASVKYWINGQYQGIRAVPVQLAPASHAAPNPPQLYKIEFDNPAQVGGDITINY